MRLQQSVTHSSTFVRHGQTYCYSTNIPELLSEMFRLILRLCGPHASWSLGTPNLVTTNSLSLSIWRDLTVVLISFSRQKQDGTSQDNKRGMITVNSFNSFSSRMNVEKAKSYFCNKRYSSRELLKQIAMIARSRNCTAYMASLYRRF